MQHQPYRLETIKIYHLRTNFKLFCSFDYDQITPICRYFLLISCGSTDKNSQVGSIKDSTSLSGKSTTLINKDSISEDMNYEDEMEQVFVVIVDTGNDYYKLHAKMFDLRKSLNLPIDTMGRYYDKAKNLILLPDNDSDEVLAGGYFIRRDFQTNLSLEYLGYYKKGSKGRSIALVAGIFENKKSADSLCALIKPIEKNAIVTDPKLYMGCMH